MHDLHGEGAAVKQAALLLDSLATNYIYMKQYNKAEDYYLRALTTYRQISLGADS